MPRSRRPRRSWVRWFWGDFDGGTKLFSNAEVGQYLRLLHLQLDSGASQAIPADLAVLARVLSEAPTGRVLAKFREVDGSLRHERLAEEFWAGLAEFEAKGWRKVPRMADDTSPNPDPHPDPEKEPDPPPPPSSGVDGPLERSSRWVPIDEIACPECENRGALKRSSRGDGWFCGTRLGGCGAQFELTEPLIYKQLSERAKEGLRRRLGATLLQGDPVADLHRQAAEEQLARDEQMRAEIKAERAGAEESSR